MLSVERLVAVLIADQCGSHLRWWREFLMVVVVVVVVVEVVERRSLKLRVRLERARLERALEEAKVRSVAVELKLKSRSVSDGQR